MNYLGIDLGGTNVAAGVVTEKGELLGKASVPTPRGAEAVADAIALAARQAAASFILLAPTSRISPGSRPARAAAASMRARMAWIFAAMLII